MAGIKVNIGADETSAILQADSTTQGALVPRMTTVQRAAIAAPATGLLVYDTDVDALFFYNGAAWRGVGSGYGSSGPIELKPKDGWPSTTNGCSAVTKHEYGTNDVDIETLDFDPDAIEYAQWTKPTPLDYDGGTMLAVFSWTAAASAGDVVWCIQGRSYANNDAIDQAWGAAQTQTDTLTAVDDVCISAATPAITIAGTPVAGEMLQVRVYRNATAGGDTLDADARLMAVGLVYTKIL